MRELKITHEILRRPGNKADGEYRFHIDVKDDDGTRHNHSGQDKSAARALSLAAYHWCKYEEMKNDPCS